jgi:histone H3/H4
MEEQPAAMKASFPQARVKNIMRQDKEVHLVATDAVYVVSVATELFLEILGRESFAFTNQEGRKTISYKDVCI